MKKTMEAIGIINDMLDREYPENSVFEESKEKRQLVTNLLEACENAYIVVQWSDVQILMAEDWFEKEAILDIECKHGGNAFFIPIERLL